MELNEEFTSMALGLGLDVRTNALPPPNLEADEGTLGQVPQDDKVFQSHQAETPTQRRREERQK